MKLKKIASLALAGIMAVSMLAGCNGAASSGDDNGTTTTPVDNSFAASVNAEMNDKQKAIVTFESSADLASAVNAVADKFDSNELNVTKTDWPTNDSIKGDFRDMLDADADEGVSTVADWNTNTSKRTAADIIIVPGRYTEEGLAKEIATFLGDKVVKNTVMPNGYKDNSANKFYKYTYTGDLAVTKVESLDGKVSAYVVGVVIEQTPTEVAL